MWPVVVIIMWLIVDDDVAWWCLVDKDCVLKRSVTSLVTTCDKKLNLFICPRAILTKYFIWATEWQTSACNRTLHTYWTFTYVQPFVCCYNFKSCAKTLFCNGVDRFTRFRTRIAGTVPLEITYEYNDCASTARITHKEIPKNGFQRYQLTIGKYYHLIQQERTLRVPNVSKLTMSMTSCLVM